MPRVKAKELREMTDDQLDFTLREARAELFKLKFQASTEKLDVPSNLKKRRREIARLLTIVGERAASNRNKQNA
jgi:large subunit ribosomal protein L29